jgi:hypothetical protein
MMPHTAPDPVEATPTPTFVPTARLAEILVCHPKTVLRLAQQGKIPPPLIVGGLRRWDLNRVLAALARA